MLRREIRELRDIAGEIDNHAKNGEPYSLTFFNSDQAFRETENPELLTETQRERLEAYLREHFKIWATTWLFIESDRIRKLIGGKELHT